MLFQGSPVTSATMSPQHTPYVDQKRQCVNSSPVAVRAAVHRADTTTGTITTTGVTRTTAVRTPSSHKSEGSLDHSNQNNIQTGPEYRSETCLPKRQLWQRSASCRELYDFSFEDSGKAKHKSKQHKKIEKTVINLEERRLESPITRYDDHRALYAVNHDNSLEIHQDIMMPDQKVYSSSYPGTTIYSQESVEDPGNYDLRDSQDDLSHDSYELIERSDDDYSTSGDYKYRKSTTLNARSCSLDSGNYLPSDTDSDLEKRHKCKSSSDVHQDILVLEDPRDFPREIIPRKSDGSFYKAIKSSSRTSSLESKTDYYECRGKMRKKGSFGSRTSSQESKSDYETKRRPNFITSRSCSAESKSEYSDALSKTSDYSKYHHDYDRKIHFERNYGTQKPRHDGVVPEMTLRETSHVHSISLQNVETEQSIRAKYASLEQNTIPRTSQRSGSYSRALTAAESEVKQAVTHIWPEKITGMSTEIVDWSSKQRSTESESNIFSFDEDRIQSLQESDVEVAVSSDTSFGVVPNIDQTNKKVENGFRNAYRDIFMEIEPSRLERGRDPLLLHQPIERTKSDPNSLARQRINSNRRMFLMHQKSIDLTPAESSDEDYLYKQIPSAPPITKYRGTHFEMPTAEFGHFDILKREIEGQKTKFEVPKRQFEILGAKTQFDLINLPPKNEADIPYVLHKRHIVNGTEEAKNGNDIEQRFVPDLTKHKPIDEAGSGKQKIKPKSPVEAISSSFLFTQNIDLSKIDPVTLEIDKTAVTVQHISSPKRDITRIDPILLEALSSKLSQIESDSPTSSKTESLKPIQRSLLQAKLEDQKPEIVKVKVEPVTEKIETERKAPDVKPKEKIKMETKPKRVIKPRMQPGKKAVKNTKTKVRITSFSSDDESLDSDDVFGSAEATPTKLEFSPPQMRKEMESILKFESERKYLQYTMSSTEVEGSPPQTRKKKETQQEQNLELTQTELRRISERSFSLPSSEDDLNIKTSDLQPVFPDPLNDLVPETAEDGDKSVTETRSEQITVEEVLKEKSKNLDDEMEREKQLLQSEIEEDLKNLNVPPKTKITEITSPSVSRKSQSPLLHARLNLSEGSAFTLLQKQQALESPLPGRRAKSLDAPVIPVNKLPPLNAFSSKDDTVEEEDHTAEDTETAVESEGAQDVDKSDSPVETSLDKNLKPSVPDKPQKISEKSSKPDTKMRERQKSGEKDQIVPDVITKSAKKSSRPTLQTKPPQKPTSTKTAAARTSSQKEKLTKLQKPHLEKSITPPQKSLTRMEKISQKASALEKPSEKPKKSLPEQKSLPTQASLQLPEIKRAKSQEIESNRKSIPKEKTRSLDKIEFKRMSSKERTKSQEESDTDIAKRKEKQQMLYETAVKQTLKSPVKDVLPVFPQVEEMVRERHGKLEISINTIENTTVSLEEAIIITKSPKKLDKKIDKKLTKSLELNLSEGEEKEEGKVMHRLGKSLDLDNRPKEQEKTEFDFKPETVKTLQSQMANEEISPELDDRVVQKTVEAQVHITSKEIEDIEHRLLQDIDSDKIVLEGTSLDVWLSLSDKNKPMSSNLENIKVIQKSDDFFDRSPASKPPDLGKSSKSSSDSQSLEKMSLGNSLDIKYIDDSGDSSHKSEKDAHLIAEMQKASETVGRFLKRKLEKRKKVDSIPSATGDELEKNLVRITSEDESLTEVSDLKCEVNSNLLAVEGHRDVLLKLSIERSRSEDTGSWITVECDEYVGTEESFETDVVPLDSPEKDPAEVPEITKTLSDEHQIESSNLLTTDVPHRKIELLKRSSDQSKSSDTGSWTSGEKDTSPSNVNEKGTGDESSVSYSMGRTFGLSQTIEKFASKEQMDKGSPEMETPKSPRSPRSPRICVLGRAFTIDEESGFRQRTKSDESSSEGSNEMSKDLTPIQEAEKDSGKEDEMNGLKYRKTRYPFEEKWSSESELGQRLQQKIVKKLSSAEKGSFSSVDDSYSERKRDAKGSLHSFEKLSTESRNSVDTESSSGSLGVAVRMQKSGDIPKELSSTWKPFPLDSSGSSSFEEGFLPPDREHDQQQEYFMCKEGSSDFAGLSEVCHKGDDSDATPTKDGTQLPDDLANFSTTFNYPSITSNISGIGINITAADMLTGYCTTFLSRTLSRISERSTNSEKSSLDEDSTKISTQSDSINDESLASSDRQPSISSDSASNARVSESEKKTPTNEKTSHKKSSEKQSSEAIPNINNLLQRQVSDDRRTSAEMAELSMDDIEIITSERGLKLKRQGSDDTVIDEECFEGDNGKKESSSQSEEWPLPEIPNKTEKKSLMALHEAASTDTSQQTTQVFQPPCSNIPKTFGLRGSLKSQDSEQWPSPPSSIKESAVTGNVETYYITPPQEACKVTVDSNNVSIYDNDSNSDKTELDVEKSHTYENVPIESISESISESLSPGASGVKIVLERKSDSPHSCYSDEDLNLNDDVFVDSVDASRNELRPPTALRKSDDSSQLKPPSPKGSHSSHSEEECSSSLGTNLEDGTVRYALKPTKCTHSSHSEDTSIALSLSEWSNSANTVKFQNLSSNSGTKSSSGLKSDDNSLTDIAQSISEWSTSNSNTLKAQQQTTSLQFQKLSSTTSTGDSSTLTEFLPTISDWSSSDTSKTLVAQQFFSSALPERTSVSRLGSSIDDGDQLPLKSPQNIPSEDLAVLASIAGRLDARQFTKSTERPVVIHQKQSDTESDQKTVHTQRYDKEKQKYSQKNQISSSKSTERPVKVPLKLAKCSYYSSSLSSESTPQASTSPIPLCKTATVPLTRSHHRKVVSRTMLQTKSPPSENDSTSSMESPKSKSERDRRGYRRRRQTQSQKRYKTEKHEEDAAVTEYNDYIRGRGNEHVFQYENISSGHYCEASEEGYFPDGDSQSGSDIFRMEREEDKSDVAEGFDVSSIPPPLLDDDFDTDRPPHI